MPPLFNAAIYEHYNRPTLFTHRSLLKTFPTHQLEIHFKNRKYKQSTRQICITIPRSTNPFGRSSPHSPVSNVYAKNYTTSASLTKHSPFFFAVLDFLLRLRRAAPHFNNRKVFTNIHENATPRPALEPRTLMSNPKRILEVGGGGGGVVTKLNRYSCRRCRNEVKGLSDDN